MKRLIVFAFFVTLSTVVLFRFNDFEIGRVEALLRAIAIVVFSACLYYFQIEEKNWVFIRLKLIKNLGHLSGILVHTLICTAIWIASITVIMIMVVSKDMKEFLPLLILNAVFFSGNLFTKKAIVDKAFTEGIPLDMEGNMLYDNCELKYWDPTTETFIEIGRNWWHSERGTEIHFRTGAKKEKIETRPLYEVLATK